MRLNFGYDTILSSLTIHLTAQWWGCLNPIGQKGCNKVTLNWNPFPVNPFQYKPIPLTALKRFGADPRFSLLTNPAWHLIVAIISGNAYYIQPV